MVYSNTFYSTIADRRRRGTYDKETELRAYTATAISATTSSTGVSFPVRKTADYKVCYSIAAYTGYVSTTAEWNITVEVSDVVGGSYTQVGTTIKPVGTALEGEIPLTGDYVTGIDADSAFIRVTATKTGSPGNLTYGAWLAPC